MLWSPNTDPSLMHFEGLESPEIRLKDHATCITVELLQHVPASGLSLFSVASDGFQYAGPNVTYTLHKPKKFMANDEIAQQARSKNKEVADFIGFIEDYRAIDIQYIGVSDKRILLATPLRVQGKEKSPTGEPQIEFCPRDIMDMLGSKEGGFKILPKETLDQMIKRSAVESERKIFKDKNESVRRAKIEKYGGSLTSAMSAESFAPNPVVELTVEEEEKPLIKKERENVEKELKPKKPRAKRVPKTQEQIDEEEKKKKRRKKR